MRTRLNLFADGANPPSALFLSHPLTPPNPSPAPTVEDQDTGDVIPGIDEDALNADDLDTDQLTSPED